MVIAICTRVIDSVYENNKIYEIAYGSCAVNRLTRFDLLSKIKSGSLYVANIRLIEETENVITELEYTDLHVKEFSKNPRNHYLNKFGVENIYTASKDVRLMVNCGSMESIRKKAQLTGLKIVESSDDCCVIETDKTITYYTDKDKYSVRTMQNLLSDLSHTKRRIKRIGIDNLDTSEVRDMSQMFYNVLDVDKIQKLDKLDCSGAITAEGMFASTKGLAVDLSQLDFSNVRFMKRMFDNADFTTLCMPSSTQNVVTMNRMFHTANIFELDLSQLRTDSVKSMADMFYKLNTTYLNVSNFNTGNCINMSGMFAYCHDVIGIDKLNTERVENMEKMFAFYSADKLILKNFNTENVTTISYMFESCNIGTLDLSSFSRKSLRLFRSVFNNAKIGELILRRDQKWILKALKSDEAECGNITYVD